MPRSFNLRGMVPKGDGWKEPRFLVRVVLGLLLLANLAGAGIAFNLFGPSPQALDAQLMAARARLQADQARLMRSRLLSSNIGKGKTDGDTFLTSYFTTRRRTYSTIISEITEIAKGAGMKAQEWKSLSRPYRGVPTRCPQARSYLLRPKCRAKHRLRWTRHPCRPYPLRRTAEAHLS